MEKKEYIINLSSIDQVGIVAAVTGMMAKRGLLILELSQYSDPKTNHFFMRIHFETTKPCKEEEIRQGLEALVPLYDISWELHDTTFRPKVVIMVSKLSHCLNDLLYRQNAGHLPIDIVGVVSNHDTLKQMTSWYDVPFYHFPITPETKESQEERLLQLIEKEKIDLVILARYMQILSENLCEKMAGKIINIHHSFLPSFKGARPYHQAYDRGVKIIGATAHYVTADLDEGPIIDQEVTRVRHDFLPTELVRLGQDVECQVLARAVKWHVEQRVILNGNKTVVFNP